MDRTASAPQSKTQDLYVEWLRYASAGMLYPGNLDSFDYAMQHLSSNAPIVEIGCFCGLSTNLLSYFKRLRSRSNLLISCDNWSFSGAEEGKGFPHSLLDYQEYRTLVMDSCKRNVGFFSREDLPHIVEMNSADFFSAWKDNTRYADIFGRVVQLGGPISFCYIDGDHSPAGVRRDFRIVESFVEPGGFVLLDDSADAAFPGVSSLAAEVAADNGYELVLHNPNTLFRKSLPAGKTEKDISAQMRASI